MKSRNNTWASRAVFVFVLALLAVMSAALYAIHGQQKEALEKAFVQNVDTLLLGIDIQSGGLIESFDWPILERVQQEAAATPLVKRLWIEDFLSQRSYGEPQPLVAEGVRRFSRDIVVDGEPVGRVVAFVSSVELGEERASSLRLAALVLAACALAVISVVVVFVYIREQESRKLLAAQASRIKAEEALSKSVDNFRVMAEDLGEGVLIHRNGVPLFTNQAFLKTFSLPDMDALGGAFSFAFLPYLEEDGRLMQHGAGGKQQLDARVAEQVEVQRNGQPVWLEIRSFPMSWDGRLAVCSTVVDISARRQAETLLEQARSDAELANNAKSVFLSSMSHELRTPLNAVLGFGQLLESDPDEPLSENQKECVEQVTRGGKHLLELINDVLDLAKIEAGKVDVSIEEVSPVEVLEDCMPFISVLAVQRGIEVAVPKTTKQRMVRADHTRLKQVLINLMSNAVKYNRDNGTVTVSFDERDDDVLRVAVADTGAGIPVEKQKELFQPFSRLGAEHSEAEGSGIGLVISKKLAELMGCSIGFESKPGEGSTFWIDMPLAEHVQETRIEQTETATAQVEELFEGMHGSLLYVEDNRSNLRLMELIVARFEGLSMLSAREAEAGIELARQEKPDVIILDINLQDMSGFEVLQHLRRYPETQDIPVCALTAAATKRDIEKGQGAGFFRYLTKPVDVTEVVTAIKAALDEIA